MKTVTLAALANSQCTAHARVVGHIIAKMGLPYWPFTDACCLRVSMLSAGELIVDLVVCVILPTLFLRREAWPGLGQLLLPRNFQFSF